MRGSSSAPAGLRRPTSDKESKIIERTTKELQNNWKELQKNYKRNPPQPKEGEEREGKRSSSEKADNLWNFVLQRNPKELEKMPTKEEDKGSSVRKPTTSEKEFQKNPNELDKNWTRSQQKKTTKDHEWETDLWQRGNFGRMWIWNVSELLLLTQWQLICWGGVQNFSDYI